MFRGFLKSKPSISIFHNPASPPSQRALALLRAALTAVPRDTGKNLNSTAVSTSKTREASGTDASESAGPLEFDLEVVEAPPTADQLRTILGYLSSSPSPSPSPSASASIFLSAHPSSSGLPPTSSTPSNSNSAEREGDANGTLPLARIPDLGRTTPAALRWPVVVDWMGGRAVVGDVDGVRGMLDAIRREQGRG